jgi:ATPase subunit of ABC transporter with duplicated ATPase domains
MLAKEQRFIERFSAHAAKAAQVQSRVEGARENREIELPKKRQVVKFDFRAPARSGEQVAVLEGVTKKYGRRVVHDGDPDDPARRALVRDGKERRRQVDAAEMVAGVLAPDAGAIRLGASLEMGTSRSRRSTC